MPKHIIVPTAGGTILPKIAKGFEELVRVADAGGVMPPKSTWFEPKLRDAMFCHLL